MLFRGHGAQDNLGAHVNSNRHQKHHCWLALINLDLMKVICECNGNFQNGRFTSSISMYFEGNMAEPELKF